MTARWGPEYDPPHLDAPLTWLCCGQRHFGSVCPDGLVVCCVCFSRFTQDQLYTDPADGRPVDVCLGCAPSAGLGEQP